MQIVTNDQKAMGMSLYMCLVPAFSAYFYYVTGWTWLIWAIAVPIGHAFCTGIFLCTITRRKDDAERDVKWLIDAIIVYFALQWLILAMQMILFALCLWLYKHIPL